ncbi:putative mitochondrial protein AtMg00300 [Bidens hawaiensis]|uniref:putative mitochondrial protein AtMg00300 n=1 Tax=Bidens hawaiensis TaxID=980011 RepID=UPI00404B62F5
MVKGYESADVLVVTNQMSNNECGSLIVSLKGGKSRVIKGSMVIMTGTRRSNNIYVLDGHVIQGSAMIAEEKEMNHTMLWHKRLGYMSEQGLLELGKQQLLIGLKQNEVEFCEHCVMGKEKRFSFKKGIHTTKGILDYTRANLWGPAKVESLGWASYF